MWKIFTFRSWKFFIGFVWRSICESMWASRSSSFAQSRYAVELLMKKAFVSIHAMWARCWVWVDRKLALPYRNENGTTTWMQNSTPNHAAVVQPLHKLMQSIYAQVGNRTKFAVQKFHVGELWMIEQEELFKIVIQELSVSVKYAHSKLEQGACLFTDASDTHWATILTQTSEEDRRSSVKEQLQDPLSFLSKAPVRSTKNWKTPEKEGYAIVEAFCRLYYLIVEPTVSVYTDHRNLHYIHAPLGANPKTHKHTASKFCRWVIKLGAFGYVIEHILCDRNLWADLQVRCAASSLPCVDIELEMLWKPAYKV